MADYSNSPLNDPNFLKSDPFAESLNDENFVKSAAVGARNGNDIAADDTFTDDMLSLSYGQIEAKYGRDVADNQNNIRREIEVQNRTAEAERSAGDILADTLLGVGAGANAVVGGLTSTALGAAGYVDEKINGDGKPSVHSAAAAKAAEISGSIGDFITGYQSDELKARQDLGNIESQLDSADSEAQFQADVAAGQNTLKAGLAKVGRDFLNSGERVLSDGAVAGDIVAQGLGSLAPSSILAKAGMRLSQGAAARVSASKTATRIAETSGSAAMIGLSEASGTYSDTVNQVMGMSHDELMAGSDDYAQMIGENLSPEEARLMVATDTAGIAFARQYPAAVALGVLSARFEASPMTAFKGSSMIEGLRKVGVQTLEEAGQGSSSQFNTNLAVQQNADRSQSLTDGIGEQAAVGAIAGAGLAGAVAVPQVPGNLFPKVDVNTVEGPAPVDPGELLKNTLGAAGSVIDAASSAGSKAFEATAPARKTVSEKVQSVAAPAVAAVEDYVAKPDPALQAETVVALTAAQQVMDTVEATTPGSASKITRAPEAAKPVPSTFADTVPEGGTILQNVTGVMQKLADPKVKINRMADTDVLFAVEQFQELESSIIGLPSGARTELKKVLSSSQVKTLRNMSKKIDLNASQTPDTEITDNVVTDTVRVAKTNPTNVNPAVVNKILKQNTRTDISDADIKMMESAAKIASAVNTHGEKQVEISNEKRVALSQKPDYQADPKKLDRVQPEITADSVSRSVQVGGFTDKRGKKLRSVNDFAADIFKGAQSEDGSFFNEDGLSVPVAKVAEQFGLFVQHMTNKTEALNTSAAQAVNGKGPTILFDSLVGGDTILPAGSAGGAKGVFFHESSPRSVEVSRQVANDAAVAAEVYNTLVDTFPDLFPNGPVEVPTLRPAGDAVEATVEENQNDEPQTQEQAEQVPSEVDDVPVEDREGAGETAQEEQEADAPSGEVTDDQSSDGSDDVTPVAETLTDDDDNAIRLYHGTNASFDSFEGNRIFLTNEKSLANEHALRNGFAGARVIETNVALANPLVREIGNDETADAYYLKNTIELEGALESGDYDGLVLFNDKGEMLVIATDDSQVTQIPAEVRPVVEEAPAERDYANLPEKFSDTYSSRGDDLTYYDGQSLIEQIMEDGSNTEFGNFALKNLPVLMDGANAALETATVNKLGKKSVKQIMLDGQYAEIENLMELKPAMLVDPATGEYDPQLLSLASAAVIDWMSGVRSADPSKLEDTMEDLGITYDMITGNEMQNLSYGVPPHQAAEAIAKQTLKLWNVNVNPDAPMVDSRGAVEGLAKELLSVAADNGLIEFGDIPVMVEGSLQRAQTINVKALGETQEKLGLNQQNAITKALQPETSTAPSFGSPITQVDQTQSRGDVPLSKIEKDALKTMQSTPHMESPGVAALTEAFGFDSIFKMLGGIDLETFKGNRTLLNSVIGKNMSIERDFDEAMSVLNGLRDSGETQAFYPVAISKVGRHQFKGINPQNNKILRAMVTPTHSTLDMTTPEHRDAFWLTVAQASDLRKVENEDHAKILSEIEQQFSDKFGDAVDAVVDWMKTGELNQQALTDGMGQSGMAELSAVVAVAQYEFAKANGTEANFETTLSFELDGKTDGPANMMNNFGQGRLTSSDMQNFNRVGFFLGKIGSTLNRYFSVEGAGNRKNVDLYETTSRAATKELYKRIANSGASDKEIMYAAARFASKFGSFKQMDNGDFEMTRNTSKNPMTKTVYGSGVRGVGVGIAQDMVVKFYSELTKVPDGSNEVEALDYPELHRDVELLFGELLPEVIDINNWEFSSNAMEHFKDVAVNGIGDILSKTAKQVIGNPITRVNDNLVMLTNVQTTFLQKLFDKRVQEVVDQRAAEGKIRTNKQGKGILRELSKRDYDSIVKELSVYAPLYSNGAQTLAVGSFAPHRSKVQMSATMDGKLRSNSTMTTPQLAGVKVIPYLSIGRGDAMMMNTIYGADNAPKDTLNVFDGIDMPVSKVKAYADQINGAVMANWDTDILGDVVNDYESFLRHVGDDGALLSEAFQEVMSSQDNGVTTTAQSAEALLVDIRENRRQNLARKKVFKRIPVSVDHMGGSDSAFTRGEGEMSMDDINAEISKELNTTSTTGVPGFVESYTELNVTNADVMIDALIRETKDKNIRDTVRAVKDKLPSGLRVVTGTLDQMNEYRQENYGDDGQVLTEAGSMDQDNNVLFLMDNNPEVLAHELVHAATFGAVKAHYDGVADPAVQRLEDLMTEFMGLNFTTSDAETRTEVNRARNAILEYQGSDDSFSKAAALNEFMAWTLTNTNLTGVLKTTRTRTLANLTKKVIQLMKRMMGGVPNDMFSSILFNAKLLDGSQPPADGGNGGGDDNGNGGDNEGGDVTPTGENTNFWLDLIRDRLDAVVTNSDKEMYLDYENYAQNALDKLDFGGFTMNEYQKSTFKAIHMILATEMRLNTNSANALNRVFEHVTNTLTPDMIGGEQRFAAVMDVLGSSENDQGVSDAIATLLALSQTSKGFREALDQIPQPEGATEGETGLNERLVSVTSFMMQKAVGTIDSANPDQKGLLDELATKILREDDSKEYAALKHLMSGLNKADTYLSGAMSKLSEKANTFDQKTKDSDRSRITKGIASGMALAAGFLDESRAGISASGAKDVLHFGRRLDKAVFVREFLSEVVGTDKTNTDVVSLLSEASYNLASVRQGYREDVPVLLQDEFENSPDLEDWQTMYSIMGTNDFSAVFDLHKPDDSFRLITSDGFRNRKILAAEKAIYANFKAEVADTILEKSLQLADAMNQKGDGHMLWKNAYAINKLAGEFKDSMTSDIDALVTLYAIEASDPAQREQIKDMYLNDPMAMQNVAVYMQALNKEEDMKTISETARLNGRKGYVPNQGAKNARLKIVNDSNREDMQKQGYIRIGTAPADDAFSSKSYGYYKTTAKQGGAYSQGVMQSVQDTYRGVDATTGLTVDGSVSGVISGNAIDPIIDQMNRGDVKDGKEVLSPVYDENGVVHFERVLNPDLVQEHVQPESNLALMLGQWAGRQVEEKYAHQYNSQLISRLKEIWDNRLITEDELFVDMSDESQKDQIYRDTWNVISPQTKKEIAEVFGEEGFMVRRDMINLSLGYRDPSILDVWSGKTRVPDGIQKAIQAVGKLTMGDNAMKWVGSSEDAAQGVVSTAKDLIVVKSLVVPYMNAQANVFQLSNLGIPWKQIIKGFREKLVEIEQFNINDRKIKQLDARILLAATDENQVKLLKKQKQVILDENSRMSISPLISAGLYTNISEGITELDVDITKGRLGDWVESQVNKLPGGVRTVAKYGIMSKDTALYKGASKAVQYGDFLAKAVYYDHLRGQGHQGQIVEHEDALRLVIEQFVNFSVLPGRTRSYLDSMGATWFLTFKIRIMKIAMSQLRNNPVRSLILAGTVGDLGSPVNDNLAVVAAEDRLGYSLGTDMLIGSPELNPWMQLADWLGE